MKKFTQSKIQLSVVAVLATTCLLSTSVHAKMPANAVLSITKGEDVTTQPTFGSYFSISTIATILGIEGKSGLTLGYTQDASSETGCLFAGITEGIDKAWCYYSNAGVHKTVIAPTVLSDDAMGNVTIDLSGWRVSWNGSDVDLGGLGGGSGNDGGIATVSCSAECNEGDSYVLDHFAADPGIWTVTPYTIHLEGIISIPFDVVNPIDTYSTDGNGIVTAGVTALSVGKTSGGELTNIDTGVDDPEALDGNAALNQCIGGCVDFEIAGISGTSAEITFALSTVIPTDAVYRILDITTGTWSDFDESGTNTIASAMDDGSGFCQSPAGIAYTPGLTAGDTCIKLTIEDGGSDDADGVVNGTVMGHGGVALLAAPVGGGGSDSSGCNITPDSSPGNWQTVWALPGVFLVWIAALHHRHRKVFFG